MKFTIIGDNKDYSVLTEANLNKIVNGHDKDGYVIISAYRQTALENPKSNQELIDENNKKTELLKLELRDKKYSYIPVYGGYKEKGQDVASIEKSFIVFPFDIVTHENCDFEKFKSDMIKLGNDYNQDSILIKEPDKDPQYFDCKEGKYISKPFVKATLNDAQREYFTALKSWSDISKKGNSINWEGKPQRFTYEESYLNMPPCNIMSKHCKTYARELT